MRFMCHSHEQECLKPKTGRIEAQVFYLVKREVFPEREGVFSKRSGFEQHLIPPNNRNDPPEPTARCRQVFRAETRLRPSRRSVRESRVARGQVLTKIHCRKGRAGNIEEILLAA